MARLVELISGPKAAEEYRAIARAGSAPFTTFAELVRLSIGQRNTDSEANASLGANSASALGRALAYAHTDGRPRNSKSPVACRGGDCERADAMSRRRSIRTRQSRAACWKRLN
jgi:hypothetical protein